MEHFSEKNDLPKQQVLHERIFNFLLNKHYQAKEIGTGDFFFMMNAEELDKRLWFPLTKQGDLLLTFWTSVDSKSDYDIFLQINENEGVILNIVSEDGILYHDKISIADKVGANKMISNENIFIKNYSTTENLTIELAISEFLKTDKAIIDKLIKAGVQQQPNIHDSAFFMSKELFYDKFYKILSQKAIAEPIDDQSDYINLAKYPPLPFAIRRFYIRNYRGIKECTIEKLPLNAQWIFVTGENGFGKTSLLQALAAGLFGPRNEIDERIIPENATIEIEYIDNGTKKICHSGVDTALSTPRSVPMACYGSSRLQPQSKDAESSASLRQNTITYHLFNSDGLLRNIERRLIESKTYNSTLYELIVDTFKALLPNLARVEIEIEYPKNTNNTNSSTTIRPQDPQVKYYEKDSGQNEYTSVEFKDLAAGYRNIILMVGDMVTRLLERQEVTNFKELQAIVFIDEIELHLHPRYQRLLPQKLSELFPKIQFIASTHSPIPLLGASANSIFLRVNRDKDTGIIVTQLNETIEISRMQPNSLFTSPIFGFQDIFSEEPKENFVYSEDKFSDIKQKQANIEKISNGIKGNDLDEFIKALKEE